MIDFFYLIPIALALGATALGAFLWALNNGQYDDLDGAAQRILFEDELGTEPPAGDNATSIGDGRGVVEDSR